MTDPPVASLGAVDAEGLGDLAARPGVAPVSAGPVAVLEAQHAADVELPGEGAGGVPGRREVPLSQRAQERRKAPRTPDASLYK